MLNKDEKSNICDKCHWPISIVTDYTDSQQDLQQAYVNLPSAKEECADLKQYIQKQFRVCDEDIIWMQDSDYASTVKTFNDLENALAMESDKVLIIYAIAGHGTLKQGSQCMLINEFDESNNFYKRFAGE